MIKRNLVKGLVLIILLVNAHITFAGEGMWLPMLLKSLNEGEMQSMGMKMSAEDVYSVNKGSLKDAIVHFGGFCTSEIISDQGLLLTNHHCGYGQIQSHTSLENNYIRDGFWATSMDQELSNPGLTATFIVRMDDVTEAILKGVTDEMNEKTRQATVSKNIELLKATAQLSEYEDISVKPFYKGNQYFSFTTITYKDVRLVGTPPESIGKFGADTDNWVWPRHTGDFALFRIYADENNMPAEYSPNNKPYKPKHFLPISLDGVAQDDFTLVFGFPGRTNEYLPSYAVQQTVDVLNPAKIEIRDKALKIVDAEMRADPQIKIQYASKFARIANYWKKWIGESQGLKATDGVGKKQRFEAEFTKRALNLTDKKKKRKKKKAMAANANAEILPQFEQLYEAIEPYALTRDYFNEVVYRNVELLSTSNYLVRLVNRYENNGEEGYNNYKARLEGYLKGFYKDYQPKVDKKVFAALMELYHKNVPIQAVTGPVDQMLSQRDISNYNGLADYIYDNTLFTRFDGLMRVFAMNPDQAVEKIKADPAYLFMKELTTAYHDNAETQYDEINKKITTLMRSYMKAQMQLFPEKTFYPDANSTMRVTYGKVAGYEARDAVFYKPNTYLEGVMEKYVPGDYEFDVKPKLIDLYEKKDYGQYGENGKMPVCFIGTNHTTGGNSGSPAIDAYGNLIGLNFDRAWEGTMSDINYDPSICRNIMVDIRYVLFIVDKFAGATNLIDEMKLVHPKAK